MDNTQITITYAGQEPRAHLAFVEFMNILLQRS